MTLGPSDTDADARPARKPKPVRPRAVPPSAVPPKAVRPKAVRPKAGRPKVVRSAKAAGPTTSVPPKPTTVETQADPLIGKTIGRCRLLHLVGVGRTARVYAAHYEALDDTVAIKILRDEVARNPVLVERFQSEARAIAKVDNENVLKIYDVGTTEDGLYYMVVELLEGEEIFELLQREERVEPMDALRIVRQAANGLAAAHGHGLVHRDVKPQNLFLLEDGTVKVVDFGLATGVDEKDERVGTPHYMAPEVCEHAKAETASDIYGLGITLFHLLTGQPPYAGKDIKGIMRAHIAGEPLRPERAVPGLAKDIGEVVRHLTKRDPLMRPTALEVVEELDHIGGKALRQKESLKKRRHRSRARSAVARRERAGKSAPAVAAIVGALAVVGIIIAIATSGSGGGDTGPESDREATPDPGPTVEPARVVPVETPDAKKAREEAMALRARIQEGQDALTRAEQWARENWHAPADTEAVLAKYAYVKEKWKDTAPGDEAKRRITEIKAKRLHPHPDRKWTSADELAVVRESWRIAQPKVEERIAAHDYLAARELVPAPISDETGSLSRELDFWREFTKQLVAYRQALQRDVVNLPEDERNVTTPDGEGVVQRVTAEGFVVKLANAIRTYGWSQLGDAAIADLGMRTFSGKEADLLILQVAFTFAHKLKDPFWDVQLEFGVTPGSGAYDLLNKNYKQRFEAWAQGR